MPLTALGLASPAMSSVPLSSPTTTGASYTVFDKDGLRITMQTVRNDLGDSVTLNTTFSNTGTAQLSALNFQAAVPKTLKLQMMPASSSNVAPGGTATQVIRILNPSKVDICDWAF